ncbi:uncharacterized protein [Leptinotarsa decemlineata]|uniref:uncharacterized protein n=1 Tax=Leptinotarsa decemlineata TaxID=7539 RepID=UPI003D308B2E
MEYESLGHMTKLNDEQVDSANTNIFYLPHHGVIYESSSTTKLRVVFDGSCKSSNRIALNDKLLVGPTIQEDLFSILIRFRKYRYVVTADIAKMYRQVLVNDEYRDFQRIVWRNDTTQPISHYRLNTVTYGTASAGYLAIRCLKQTGIDNQDWFPHISQIIQSDFYVHDLLSGASTLEEAHEIKINLIKILDQYGFQLRKWMSNDIQLSEKPNHDVDDNYQVKDDSAKKTLGLWWHAKSDIFSYKTSVITFSEGKLTKRIILSTISKLFDPLGLLSPIVIRSKVMLQKLWQCNLGWNDSLPSNFQESWLEFIKQLPGAACLKTPRLFLNPSYKRIELYGFSDASEDAYGRCIYLESITENGNKIQLLCSKSRVAPLKSVSLPRLELCEAVLLTTLYVKVIKSSKLHVDATYFWTDSTIVLLWLVSPPNTWKVFVANRVAEIQTHTEFSQWSHVLTKDNPCGSCITWNRSKAFMY